MKLRDRVLSILNKPGMRAVLMSLVDWASAFSQKDPTNTITKFINMGLRSSIDHGSSCGGLPLDIAGDGSRGRSVHTIGDTYFIGTVRSVGHY